jgi:hypothetical protein
MQNFVADMARSFCLSDLFGSYARGSWDGIGYRPGGYAEDVSGARIGCRDVTRLKPTPVELVVHPARSRNGWL